MSQKGFLDGNYGTFIATTALAAYRRVRLVANKLVYAGAADTDDIGSTVDPVLTAGDRAAIRLVTANGWGLYTASDAITAGAACYAAANGKVAPSGTVLKGVALESATQDGDVIAVMESPAAILGSVARTGLTTDSLSEEPLLLNGWLNTDLTAMATSAGANVFGFIAGTAGSAAPYIVGEAASGNTKTDVMRRMYQLPDNYVAAGGFKVRVKAKQDTTLLTVGSTVVVAVYKSGGDGTVGSNLVATALQTLTTSYANYDFVVTATGLAAGDIFDIVVTAVATDTGGTVNKAIRIGKTSVLIDVKG